MSSSSRQPYTDMTPEERQVGWDEVHGREAEEAALEDERGDALTHGPARPTEAEAIETWNTRAALQSSEELVELWERMISEGVAIGGEWVAVRVAYANDLLAAIAAIDHRSSSELVERLKHDHDLRPHLNANDLVPVRLGDVREIVVALSSIAELEAQVARDRAELRAEIINTPETADFMAAIPLEAAHQRERWGTEHDAGKSPFDWFWLVGYLAQKAASAAVEGNSDKAMHHTISTAAALANWHAALAGKDASMRAGIGPLNGGEKPGSAYDLAAKLEQPLASQEGSTNK